MSWRRSSAAAIATKTANSSASTSSAWVPSTYGPLNEPGPLSRAVSADGPAAAADVAGGWSEYLLGTDHLGRDILSRLIYGSLVPAG